MQHGTPKARYVHRQRGDTSCDHCGDLSLHKPPAPRCPSRSAKNRHRRLGETCTACDYPRPPGPSITRPCGTPAAVRRHEYHHEPLCELCRPVARQMWRDRRQRRKQQPRKPAPVT